MEHPFNPNGNQGRDGCKAKKEDPRYKPLSKKELLIFLFFIGMFLLVIIKC
jgi:hypothetical protein